MATKIINVLRDDSFEEILDIFKQTSAKEVIFVLPKNCKAFKKEGDFAILNKEAEDQEKNISLLCSNPKVNQLAEKYNFDVLLAKNGEGSNINTVNQYESEKIDKIKKEEINDVPPWGDYELPGEPITASDLSAKLVRNESKLDTEPDYHIVKAVKIKRIEDVIHPEDDESHIKIKTKKEKMSKVAVKKEVEDKDSEKDLGIWSDWEKPKVHAPHLKKFKIKFEPKIMIAGMAGIAAILLGVVIFISTGNAKITIKPYKEPLDIILKVSASDKYTSVDTRSKKIPGQTFTIEKSISKTFSATGQKDAIQKARGKITIYNELNVPQPLVATTRFESEAGLVFRTLKTVTVPAAKSSTLGSIGVEVIADKPGQEYNMGSGKFVIVAFREKGDTEKYQKIYARSIESMHGGINGKSAVVSENDYNSAKDTITQQLTEELNESLKSQASQFKIVDASGIVFNGPESSAESEDAASEFSMTISAYIKAAGIKEDDLYELINAYALETKNLMVVPEKIEISYDKINLKDSGSTLDFDLVVKGSGYSEVDEGQIVSDLLGMSAKEIRSYFKANENIESAKIKLSPFWIKSVPKERERVDFKIEY